MSKLKIAALMIASAVGGAYLWSGQQEAPLVAARVEQVPVYLPASASGPAADAGMAIANPLGQSSTAPAMPSRSLGRALLDSTDLRAFIVDALKHPEDGGAFYTTLALRQCRHLNDPQAVIGQVVAETSTISAERMKAISATVERCAGIGEDAEAFMAAALRLGLEGKDPALSLQLQMPKTTVRTPERSAILEAMFKSPALASENAVPMRLLQEQMTTDAQGALVYRFAGQSYTDPQDQRALDAAARLATCTGTDYCALDNERAMRCNAQAGACYSSREEYLQQTTKLDQQTFDKALKFAEQIRSAIARGDTSIFR